MKKNEIVIGGKYQAKVSGKLTVVRVDNIREVFRNERSSDVYEVTNLATGRRIVFRSAQKFRGQAPHYWLGTQDRAGQITMTEWQTVDEAKEAKERAKTNLDNIRVALTVSATRKDAYEKFVRACLVEAVEQKYSTEAGATEAERQEAQDLVEDGACKGVQS